MNLSGARKSASLIVIVLLCTSGVLADDDALELGRNLTQQFYDDEIAAVWDQMTTGMQGAMGSMGALQKFRDQIGVQLGDEAEAAASPYLDYQTKASLRLPFKGEWSVFWGGRTATDNYHVVSADQRFAYDMLIIRDGSSHRGDGSEKEHYYCWGESIVAPGKGTVASVVSNLPDNALGRTDAKNPPGNHVVIDMGNDEYMLLAHLQEGSVNVAVGDEVEMGDELGRCGNSGNTSEPHIHFHLQDMPGFGKGKGKPAFIRNYRVNGVLKEQGEPKRGELVEPNLAKHDL